ncbi:hypothetical protein V1504DRAFT_472254 [Lipomyces starkeyi]
MKAYMTILCFALLLARMCQEDHRAERGALRYVNDTGDILQNYKFVGPTRRDALHFRDTGGRPGLDLISDLRRYSAKLSTRSTPEAERHVDVNIEITTGTRQSNEDN